MSDVKNCDLDFPSRLEAIRRHTDAWNNLDFPTHKVISGEGGLAWDLVRGIFTQAKPDGGISCVQMPCSIKSILEHRWVVPTAFLVRDFTIDMSQDLLVAIELVRVNGSVTVIFPTSRDLNATNDTGCKQRVISTSVRVPLVLHILRQRAPESHQNFFTNIFVQSFLYASVVRMWLSCLTKHGSVMWSQFLLSGTGELVFKKWYSTLPW